MRQFFGFLLTTYVLATLTRASSSTDIITLSLFLPISGFSSECNNAYNTPLAGCTSSDFTKGAPCSANCIASIETVDQLVIMDCEGAATDPKTLIGQILRGNGIRAICPNAAVTTAVQTTTILKSTETIFKSNTNTQSNTLVKTSIQSTLTPARSATSTSPLAISSSSTVVLSSTISRQQTSSPSLPQSPSSISSAVTSAVSSAITSTVSSAVASAITTATAASEGGFTKTVADGGSATVLTSKAQQTASDNADAFGGGGSPFEISSSSRTIGKACATIHSMWLIIFVVWLI
ncbi:hypothetical protein MMC20_006384 [Loxospora ochrophaea]|nr:hypothetical protein [Loxospora ochrophaea]